jgi:DNA polymerase III delta prime subunit
MTDTNKSKETTELRSCILNKECFESYWNKNFKEYDDNNDEQMFNMTFSELKILKQLHDQEKLEIIKARNEVYFDMVNEKDKEIKQKEFLLCSLKLISKKQDERISELQTENEKLKNHIKRCVNKIEINELKRK